jgi:hypothetical protein
VLTFFLLNWVGAVGLAAYRMLQRGRWFVLALSFVVISKLFVMERAERLIEVGFGDTVFTSLDLLPFLLLIPFAFSRRFGSAAWSFVVFGMWMLGIAFISYTLRGTEPYWSAYAVVAFVGPVLVGLYCASLDALSARRLLTRIELGVTLLALVSAGVIVGGLMLALALGWEVVPWRTITPVGGPIATGGLFLLVLPKFAYDAIVTPSPRTWVSLGLVAAGVLVSGSRAIALVGLLSAAAAVAVVTFGSAARPGFRGRIFATGVAAAGGFILYTSLAGLPAVSRLGSGFGQNLGDRMRYESAAVAVNRIERNPLIGSVPGHTYPWFRAQYSPLRIAATSIIDGRPSLVEPHNLYLLLSVEFGLLGAFGFVVFMGVVLSRLLRAEGLHVLYAIGILAYLLQALGNSGIAINPRTATVFWAVVGSAYAISWGSARISGRESRSVVGPGVTYENRV